MQSACACVTLSIRRVRRLPWFAKIATKIVLSRLPIPYSSWRRLGLFRHGHMANIEYAYRVFRGHFDLAGMAARGAPFSMLELGPGDSVLSAVFARAHGASRSILVDVDSFASRDVDIYRRAGELLAAEGLETDFLAGVKSFDELLRRCHAEYHTYGLRSLAAIPSGSIDFAWSQAVLEHVRFPKFDQTLGHLRRVLNPGGVASHCIDLQDHLGGGLNNLRFSSRRWESPLFAESGFYTNRIRFRDMLRRFAVAGFDVEVVETLRWNELPTPRSALHREFSSLPVDDLNVRGFTVVLTARKTAQFCAA